MKFYKYQGTGNDFIIFDGINEVQPTLSKEQIAQMCHRRFGIGADGLMIIQPNDNADFYMKYYNSDGGESTMCGNGGRCIAHLAHHLGICKADTIFMAADGLHQATINGDTVSLQMIDVNKVTVLPSGDYELFTGSPHYVHFCEMMALENIVPFGKSIRYNEVYSQNGINVNMASWQDDILYVATYERGVEDETYSCGTGMTAAALALHYKSKIDGPIHISTKGGNTIIHFVKNENTYTNVILEGPAIKVFEGEITI
jgi:diaminopimelate epimerase